MSVTYSTAAAAVAVSCAIYQVNNDIRDLERKLSLLRKAIVDKDLPLKVAQTRLDERTRRMNLELAHDEPMQGSVALTQFTSGSGFLSKGRKM